jgi:hypothetical protein
VAACGAFQHDEQCGGAGIGPLQAQIVIEQLRGFRRQREEAQLAALAAHAELAFGNNTSSRIQSYDFGGAESMHEHQAHDGQVARVMKTGPEARHFID